MNRDRNCLSIWFPKLLEAGVPVPRTEIVKWPGEAWGLVDLCDGKMPAGYVPFMAALGDAADRMGYPCFLRTGQGSGKHDWKHTCHLPDRDSLPAHVAALVEWSHLVDMLGLPHEVWVVREMLPVKFIAKLPRYGDMPLVPEVRAFVRDGKVECSHPYWPMGSIADGLNRLATIDANDFGVLVDTSVADTSTAELMWLQINDAIERDRYEWYELACRVAEAFKGDGYWSVDLLKTVRGWFVTDMADGAMSYHEAGCPALRKDAA